MNEYNYKSTGTYPHSAQTVDNLENRVVKIQALEPHKIPDPSNHVDEEKRPSHLQRSVTEGGREGGKEGNCMRI